MRTPSRRNSAAIRPPRKAPLRHPWLFALPAARLPDSVQCAGTCYRLVETFKHDFFAATGLYRSQDGVLAVVKFGRRNACAGLPLEWLGAFLTRRESALLERLRGVAGVPRLIGTVGRTGLVRDFVPGHPLGRRERPGDAFFDELADLLREVHARHVAYVDLNKRENILVGDDGRPYLIDFQIALRLPPEGWTGLRPLRWLLARFQRADWYHYCKHKRRLRPDLLTEQEAACVRRLGPWIRLHRLIARPLTLLRRRTLSRLRGSEVANVAGASAK